MALLADLLRRRSATPTPRRCPTSAAREWWLLAPIALAVFWMGIYPESFLRPIRNDVGRLLTRLERVAPAGDSHLTLGKGACTHGHGAMH